MAGMLQHYWYDDLAPARVHQRRVLLFLRSLP